MSSPTYSATEGGGSVHPGTIRRKKPRLEDVPETRSPSFAHSSRNRPRPWSLRPTETFYGLLRATLTKLGLATAYLGTTLLDLHVPARLAAWGTDVGIALPPRLLAGTSVCGACIGFLVPFVALSDHARAVTALPPPGTCEERLASGSLKMRGHRVQVVAHRHDLVQYAPFTLHAQWVSTVHGPTWTHGALLERRLIN